KLPDATGLGRREWSELEIWDHAGRATRNYGVGAQRLVLVLRTDGLHQWLAEIFSHQRELMHGNKGQQPHDQKKGHHRRHEVGVGDLPATPVRLLVVQFLASYYDAWFGLAHVASTATRARAHLFYVIFQFHEGRTQVRIQNLTAKFH